ncbi:hypothetical protein [Corynebacterium atypicum]|nr:hypothetical protein [Corynebacterium atypicum]
MMATGNRPADGRPGEAPRSLVVAYWLLVVGAVLSLVAGGLLLTDSAPGEIVQWDAAHAANARRNTVFVAWSNVIAGLLVAALAAYVRRGHRKVRAAACAAMALCAVTNLIGVAVAVAGPAMVLNVAVFVAAAVAMYRPSANAFVAGRG